MDLSDESHSTDLDDRNDEDCEREYNMLYYKDIFDFFDWNNSNTIPTSVSTFLPPYLAN